ncbi:hypothetical protein GX408_10610 [bacterium]|nr:hypothetical protein [bacterium]
MNDASWAFVARKDKAICFFRGARLSLFLLYSRRAYRLFALAISCGALDCNQSRYYH